MGWLRLLGAATATAALAVPSVALADNVPPNTTQSSLTCKAANGTTLRAGDDVLCRLSLVFDASSSGVTADISIPASTSFDPSAPENAAAVPNDPLAPTSVSFNTLSLGTFFPASSKSVSLRLHIKSTALAGDPIDPVATVHVPGVADTPLTAQVLTVMPEPPDLSPSTMTCAEDGGPPPLRGGDTVLCTIQLADAVNHEAANNVTAQTTLPPVLSYVDGGDSHLGQTIYWTQSLSAGVPVLPALAAPLTFHALLSPTAPGGSQVLVTAQALYKGVQSAQSGAQQLSATPLDVALTEASLATSSLRCADVDGPPLYPGNLVKCTLAAQDPSGHEDIDQLTGAAPVPAGTTVTQGKLGSDGNLTFGTDELGAVAAGATKSTFYTLRVNPDTPVGTAIAPKATLHGRSVLSGNPVDVALTALPLTVVARPSATQTDDTATVPIVVPAAVAQGQTQTQKPPAATSTACKKRKVVTVSIKPPKGKRWKSVTFKFAGKTVKGKRGKKGAFTGRLVFQNLPKGKVKVSIVGKTTKGKTVRSTKSYAYC